MSMLVTYLRRYMMQAGSKEVDLQVLSDSVARDGRLSS
jgi:hypothetical protein